MKNDGFDGHRRLCQSFMSQSYAERVIRANRFLGWSLTEFHLHLEDRKMDSEANVKSGKCVVEIRSVRISEGERYGETFNLQAELVNDETTLLFVTEPRLIDGNVSNHAGTPRVTKFGLRKITSATDNCC